MAPRQAPMLWTPWRLMRRARRSSRLPAMITLSGAGGNDLFVFAQPIGNDTISNFNAATDKIDLVGFANIASYSDIAGHITTDVQRRRGDRHRSG